jgi:hypothetical protein
MRALLLVLLAFFVVAAPASAAEHTRAGVAAVDATWHVGASAGQFTDEGGVLVSDGVDPHVHSVKKRTSDGVALRTSTRALVVADTQGDRVAIVSTDLYLPQDFLLRRVASLLAAHDREVSLGLKDGPVTGVTGENLAMTASHNHNTPYYSTPGWGTAIFQDVFDLRFYNYMADRMAQAVIRASATLVPVRMGGTTRTFNEIQSHTYGPNEGDDGTPAGQPYDHTTKQLSVVQIDDVSDPGSPKPLANWVVLGLHPEFTWGYDLINGDITMSAARMVDRELGTTSVFTQRETGTSGPHKDTRAHPPEARREFQDNGFAQLDRGARLLADAIIAARRDIETGTPQRASAYQPFVEDFDVASVSQRFAPPATRPYPGVSNCNTASLFHGDPRLPILGLPNCQSTPTDESALTPYTSQMYDQLKAAGVPVPESYSGTKLTAVEETAAVHLMAIRLGDVVATICPCEQFTDTALNIESRLDRVQGNFYEGFDWTEHKTPAGRDWCVPAGDDRWTCANPENPSRDLAPISDVAYRRFRAQIHNDARGWEVDAATLGSEAEPADPEKIKGNFTHEEHTDHGYRLVLSVGMGNDYWGYVPEYREYRSHDHYRKALSGLGPHGADFLATRLSRLGASLNGGPAVEPSPLDLAFVAEQGRAQATADGLGELGRAYSAVYERTLPADGGTPSVVAQPADIKRFSAAHLTFVGGSNYTDLPDMRVERLDGGSWKPYGTMDGDVQLMVDFPSAEEVTAWRLGTFQWKWTASFEAFSSDIAQPDASGVSRRQTPAGQYRFVVEGRHRPAPAADPRPYRLESRAFTVAPWDGIKASDLRLEPDNTVSFAAGPVGRHTFGTGREYVVGPIDYPDAYGSPFRFLDGERRLFTYGLSDPGRHQQYCPRCAFRPWADTGQLRTATVVVGKGSRTRTVQAHLDPATGRWRTTYQLRPTESARVPAGGLVDEHGETNGSASGSVTRAATGGGGTLPGPA